LIGEEWQVDEVLDSLGKINQKAIAIGIYNSENRDPEYQPNFESKNFDKRFTGNEHTKWIVNEVKPWIERQYRTKKDASSTVIGGASYGGLMAYYILTEYPEEFGGAIIMSPSFWVNEKYTELDKKVKDMENKYVYPSAGEKERGIINGAKHLNKILLKRGLKEN
jgi:alpha-glucosidase